MEKTVTLEEALKRIEELEKENAELREELEYYRNRKLSGRQKHNAKWMAIYNDFVVGYESGMAIVEIADDFLTANGWRSSMAEDKKKEIDVTVIEVTEEYLKEKLYKIRGKRVLLDADLAEIYGYDTKGFNRQVKNNIEKFDEDFMFELTDEELEDLRYKNCTQI